VYKRHYVGEFSQNFHLRYLIPNYTKDLSWKKWLKFVKIWGMFFFQISI
jgi:hypothetical protein